MTTKMIKATRFDGYGFMFARLLDVQRRHGHRYYTVKTLSGEILTLSSKQYTITSR